MRDEDCRRACEVDALQIQHRSRGALQKVDLLAGLYSKPVPGLHGAKHHDRNDVFLAENALAQRLHEVLNAQTEILRLFCAHCQHQNVAANRQPLQRRSHWLEGPLVPPGDPGQVDRRSLVFRLHAHVRKLGHVLLLLHHLWGLAGIVLVPIRSALIHRHTLTAPKENHANITLHNGLSVGCEEDPHDLEARQCLFDFVVGPWIDQHLL
mmetsp:Transcript_25402/g.47756  ORF Transcript_25402/g.47756 Transcript_25402/m.47756 type:complete len:209 (-) Transcript_25402:463-1089(-)